MAADVVSELNKRSQSKTQCTSAQEKDIEICLRPMLGYATTLQSNGLLPLEGAQVFRRLCDLYSDFTDCAGNVDCGSVSVTAMEASYGFMCGQGFPLFSKHVDCFAEVSSTRICCKSPRGNRRALRYYRKFPETKTFLMFFVVGRS